MARHWTTLQPVTSTAIVSKAYTFQPGDFPQSGPELDTTNRPRALIGWNHQDDTPGGLMKGQLYTSVNGRKLMIYDTSGNRSSNPGEVVFCGVANFTMIRMFHPYWAKAGPNNTIPRDMAYGEHKDKENLRDLYGEFLLNYYGKVANDEYVYQIPAPRKRAATENTENAEKEAKGDAGGEKSTSKQAKKPRKPRKPRGPKAQRAPNSEKKRKMAFTDQSIMKSPPNLRRLAAEDDGESLKNESRSMSVVDLAKPALRTSPGNTSANPIDLIDFEDLRRRMDRQANAVDLTGGDDSAQGQDDTPFINLLDDYMDADPEEEERLLTSWNARRGLAAQDGPVQNETSSTESSDDHEENGSSSTTEINGGNHEDDAVQPSDDIQPIDEIQRSNDEIQPSIEADIDDLQDAQLQPQVSSERASATVDEDLEMIDPIITTGNIIKADDEEDVVITGGRTDGLTIGDAIVLD